MVHNARRCQKCSPQGMRKSVARTSAPSYVHIMDEGMDVTFLTMSFALSSVSKAPVQVGDPLAFYSVAATVLPVFFLALVYQANIIDKSPFKMPPTASRLPRFRRIATFGPPLAAAGVLFYAVVGEFLALHVLATRVPSEIDKTYIGLGLYASGITLAFQRLLLTVESRETGRGLSEPGVMLQLVEMAFLLMLMLGLVLFLIQLVRGAA